MLKAKLESKHLWTPGLGLLSLCGAAGLGGKAEMCNWMARGEAGPMEASGLKGEKDPGQSSGELVLSVEMEEATEETEGTQAVLGAAGGHPVTSQPEGRDPMHRTEERKQ